MYISLFITYNIITHINNNLLLYIIYIYTRYIKKKEYIIGLYTPKKKDSGVVLRLWDIAEVYFPIIPIETDARVASVQGTSVQGVATAVRVKCFCGVVYSITSAFDWEFFVPIVLRVNDYGRHLYALFSCVSH